MADYMGLTQSVPLIYAESTIDVADVAAARERSSPKIGWSACLIKAFARAGLVVPELRRSLLTVPYTRLFEHAESVASVAVERVVDGEAVVLGFRVDRPEHRPLAEIDTLLKSAATDPFDSIREFRRQLRYWRWPGMIRRLVYRYGLSVKGTVRARNFGTFAMTSIHGSGAELLAPRWPLTTIFTYGPITETVTVRLGFDHRVMDGMTAGRILAVMGTELRTTIRDELSP
jgi:pyruvate/2-oxoglutarate dehydrogenase complex dihydrolipoamide acyltransferase (E2) component